MKGLRGIILGILVASLLMPIVVSGAENPGLLIIELQTRSSNSADEEFVEIINASDEDIDLSAVRLEYRSASGSAWNLKATLAGTLGPGKRYLLAASNYLGDIADEDFAPGFSDAGGHIRLSEGTDNEVIVHDLLGWGSAAYADGAAAPALTAGKSLQRKMETEKYVDTDDNAADFSRSDTPAPESTYEETTAPTEPEITPAPEPEPRPQPDDPAPPAETSPDESNPPEAEVPLKPLQITELMPNPASPQTDDKDEFIELFNPNSEPVELAGYKLQTGSSFGYSYTFADEIIPAGGFLIVTSGDSNLTLANTAGRARLLAPDGSIMAEAAPYEDAEESQAWSFINGSWQWTTTPTPAVHNILTVPAVAAPAAKTKAAAKPKAAVKPKASAKPAPKKPKAATKAAAKTKKTDEKPAAVLASNEDDNPPPLHPLVLASVSGLALLYAGYEYRHDVLNRIYQLRAYRAARRAARAEA